MSRIDLQKGNIEYNKEGSDVPHLFWGKEKRILEADKAGHVIGHLNADWPVLDDRRRSSPPLDPVQSILSSFRRLVYSAGG